MKYKIEKGAGAAYLQIYEQIKADIVAGSFRYNAKLPSKRLLADETDTSTVTVEHAYALLCDEGYVESRERSGYFVIFRKNDGFAAGATSVPQRPLRRTAASDGVTPEFPLSVLSKTMRRVLTDRGDMLLEKSPNSGCIELREAIKEYLARNRGIRVETEQIVIGSGAEYLYGLIIGLLGRDRVYAIETPSYNKIEQVYSAQEIRYESLPLTDSGIESAALAKTAADVLHTTPYRSYPSGVTATASKLHEYLNWAEQGDRYIIEDDFESEFSVSAKPTETLFSLSKRGNVIYLNTFSKTISPSLRIGYMVLPESLLQGFKEKMSFYSCTVPTFMQYVLSELISRGDFERHINRVRRQKRREMETGQTGRQNFFEKKF